MPPRSPAAPDILQGTLDMLVLSALQAGAMHGWGISQRLAQLSDDVLLVNQGSLYPALYRLEAEGWIESEWGTSENNRRAKFYSLTRAGAKRLGEETASWHRMAHAIGRVLQPV
ncbi:MAG: PadR family transcriptional regulator [Acidobacteria bacterium]|nr:PadR family transcriptional regulator [Acidobacteriota bacterium]